MAEDNDVVATNFPLYSVCSLKDGVFMVAGGGGKAKTGIKNAIELYELSKNGGFYVADRVCFHEMKDDLIMQSSVSPDDRYLLASSINDECHLLVVRPTTDRESETLEKSFNKQKVEDVGALDVNGEKKDNEDDSDNESDSISFSKVSNKNSEKETAEERDNGGDETLGYEFEIVETAAVISDKALKEPCQNVVEFCSDGAHVVTGGEEGCIRIWKLPKLEMVKVMRGHSKEITDLATHPQKDLCISISRDCTGIIWDLENHIQIKSFKWSESNDYRFRACCFSNYEDENYFFTLNVPVKWNNKVRQYCYLTKWDTQKWEEIQSVKIGTEMLTRIASYDKYIGIGDAIGGVAIYTTDLQLFLKKVKVHSSFVTDLCFHPMNDSNNSIVLLSVSVDKTCCLTEVKQTGSSWFKVLVILTVLVLLIAVLTKSIL